METSHKNLNDGCPKAWQEEYLALIAKPELNDLERSQLQCLEINDSEEICINILQAPLMGMNSPLKVPFDLAVIMKEALKYNRRINASPLFLGSTGFGLSKDGRLFKIEIFTSNENAWPILMVTPYPFDEDSEV